MLHPSFCALSESEGKQTTNYKPKLIKASTTFYVYIKAQIGSDNFVLNISSTSLKCI